MSGRCSACLAVCGLILAAGCRTVAPDASEASDGPGWLAEEQSRPTLLSWKDKEPPIGTPAQIVAAWTDTVLQQTGKPAQRGFGGRLFFYGAGGTTPIAVDGQLVVYAFDETDRKPSDNKPTKRYVFPPEQFKLHRSRSELGVSYSFWLPWDTVGGSQREVSLIARFEPVRGGALIVSDQTALRLPGWSDGPAIGPNQPTRQLAGGDDPPGRAAQRSQAVRGSNGAPSSNGVQTVSHDEPAPSPATGIDEPRVRTRGVETTTIRLPRNSSVLRGAKAATRPSAPATPARSASDAVPSIGPLRTTVTYSDRQAVPRRRPPQP